MNIADLLPRFPAFIDVPVPEGWTRKMTPMGPRFERGDIGVFVSENIDEAGIAFRGVTATGARRVPSEAEIKDVIEAFLGECFGPAQVTRSFRIPTMIAISRSLRPAPAHLSIDRS
jgi:hypothetical protein